MRDQINGGAMTGFNGAGLQGFVPSAIPTLVKLAKNSLLFDNWFSSMPGPTWPNRLFAHACSSAGLHNSLGNLATAGSPTRARTWDLRINSPSHLYVISLHHQLLTASAYLRHRSRMQCNAGVCKTTLLRFCIQLVPDPCRCKRRCKSSAVRAGAQPASLAFPLL